jgi:hypothetical protein
MKLEFRRQAAMLTSDVQGGRTSPEDLRSRVEALHNLRASHGKKGAAVKAFLAYLSFAKIPVAAASHEHVKAYTLDYVERRGLSSASLPGLVSNLQLGWEACKGPMGLGANPLHPEDGAVQASVKSWVRELQVMYPHVTQQATPLDGLSLQRIVSYIKPALDRGDPWYGQLLSYMALAHAGAFRAADIVAGAVSIGDLSLSSVSGATPGVRRRVLHVRVEIRKTRQGGAPEEELTSHLPEVPGSVLCPVWAVLRFLKMRGVSLSPLSPHEAAGWPLFVAFPEDTSPTGQSTALPYDSLRNALSGAAVGAGLDPKGRYTPHGIRRGTAKDLAVAGAPAHLIMNAGGWRSTTVMSSYVGRSAELSITTADYLSGGGGRSKEGGANGASRR